MIHYMSSIVQCCWTFTTLYEFEKKKRMQLEWSTVMRCLLVFVIVLSRLVFVILILIKWSSNVQKKTHSYFATTTTTIFLYVTWRTKYTIWILQKMYHPHSLFRWYIFRRMDGTFAKGLYTNLVFHTNISKFFLAFTSLNLIFHVT